MTGPAGWTGLISGTIAAVVVDGLVRYGVIAVSSQAGSFLGAAAAFVVGVAVSVVVSSVSPPKPDGELVGLVWALTPRAGMRTGEEEGRWWQSPVVLGVLVLLLTLVLYVIFQ
jgi:SSS family solute:Na+ symporter